MTDLTDRLDHLAMALHQEGRDADSAVVRRAIAALTKPAVVGTPWTRPRKGDKCVRPDGKSREAVKVTYRREWGRHDGPVIIEEPRKGYYPEGVEYLDGQGRERSCSASSSWATWCGRAVRQGGTYQRAKEAE